MRPALKIFLACLLLLSAGVALMVDTTWLSRLVERRIAAQTGRQAQIGNIELRIGRCLYVTVDDVRITNPEWARRPTLIDSQRLSGCAAWLPLLTGRLDFIEAAIESTRVALEREGDRATWTMRERGSSGASRVTARHISVRDTSVYFRDRDEKTELDIDIVGGVGNGHELRLAASGRFRDAPLQLSATTPARLPSHDAPTRVSAQAAMGRTTASATGYFTQLRLDGMNIQLSLAGDDLSEINRLGINLPGTPPYQLHGRLELSGNTWKFSSFEGRIGDSDINGELTYTLGNPRPLLRADIYARLLDFDDLGPLVGAPPKTKRGETASPEQKAQAQQVAARERVLPSRPLGIDKWPRMDADVRFRADRVRRPKAVPVNGVRAHLLIDDSTLRLQPLEFKMAGGSVVSNIVIDGKAAPPHGSLHADIENLELARMFPKLDQQQAAAGKLFGHMQIEATGDSIANLAATSSGDVTVMVNGGHMSALLLEMAGLDAGESLLILLTRGDRPVPLRCAIADINLEDGHATPEIAVVDTEDTVFILNGAVTLNDETLDLKITPQPKDRSVPVVRTPLSISGHFNDPAVKPMAAPLLARGGAAIALGLVNPLLAIIPLIETGPGVDSDCAAFARLVQNESVSARSMRTEHHNPTEVL